MPYLIWFRGAYELGLDLALFTLILPMGLIEVVVSEMMINIEANKKNFMGNESQRFNRIYLNIYIIRALIVFISSLACAVFIYYGVCWMDTIPQLYTGIVSNNEAHFVFICALISYSLICLALLNSLIIFSLSQPAAVNRIVSLALIVNMIIGFSLSRWFEYYYAVFGLLIGTIIFLVLSTLEVIRVLKNLDYYLYAAA
jgi:hypothetical protein